MCINGILQELTYWKALPCHLVSVLMLYGPASTLHSLERNATGDTVQSCVTRVQLTTNPAIW